MRIHIETIPRDAGFSKDFPKLKDRRDLAKRLVNELSNYELDWAAVYIDGRQLMFYDKERFLNALQYDTFE